MNTTATPEGLYWHLLAFATVLLITAASLIWNYEHPFGFNWDEAGYLNEMQTDINQFHAHGVPGLIKSWLLDDPIRPPAYRVFAFPFAVLLGPSPFVLRFVAILFRILTLAFVYLGVCRIDNRAAAVLSVILLALCPDFIFFGTVFYNEYALYLAVAGTCYFVFRSWNQPVGSVFDCLGLGIFLGIGALAKASFPALAGCFLGMVAFLGYYKKIAGPSPQFLLNACVVGALIAGPWWLLNFRSGLEYVRYAANFSRDGMGPTGIDMSGYYFLRFLQEGLGLPIGCLCLVVLVTAFVKRFRRQLPFPNSSSWAMICLLLAPLPTVLAPLATYNQVIYHTSQSLILLAAGLALLAKNEGWLSSPIRLVIVTMVIVAQLSLTLTPVVLRQEYPGQRFAWTALGRWDQWDWNQFRVLLRSQGLKQPSVGYLGVLSPLNPPQIQYPWLSHHEPAPSVTLLWRMEKGSPDVSALVAAAGTNDVVFTVPELATITPGTENPNDNQYNTNFAAQMETDPDFGTPLHLRMGRLHPADVWVFIRKHSHEEQALPTAKSQGTAIELHSVHYLSGSVQR